MIAGALLISYVEKAIRSVMPQAGGVEGAGVGGHVLIEAHSPAVKPDEHLVFRALAEHAVPG